MKKAYINSDKPYRVFTDLPSMYGVSYIIETNGGWESEDSVYNRDEFFEAIEDVVWECCTEDDKIDFIDHHARYEFNEAEVLAEFIRESDVWEPVILERLCDIAGMIDAWITSTPETFESVVNAAAEVLGVEL